MNNKKIKSGEPVAEKYAGVKVENEVLAFVPKIIAGRLRKAGYNVPCEYYYDYDGKLKKCSIFYDHNTTTSVEDQTLSAPRLHDVKEWLKTMGVLINVYNRAVRIPINGDEQHFEFHATKEWVRVIYIERGDKMVQYKRPINSFVSEDDALAISIREALNYLLKEDK